LGWDPKGVLLCGHAGARRGLIAVALGWVVCLAADAQTALAANSLSDADAAAVDPQWQPSLEAFAQADAQSPPRPGGVVFIGSSSIRLWKNLEQAFNMQPVITKRGFGGSRLSDCTRYLRRLVLPHRPRLVVVYAGDNDLAEGATPRQVLRRFTAFVSGVRAELPGTRIAYISIKPSPLREALIPATREANALIEGYVRTGENMDYIDVFSHMLGPDGRPRPELYREDALHLSAAGYALWKEQIGQHLQP